MVDGSSLSQPGEDSAVRSVQVRSQPTLCHCKLHIPAHGVFLKLISTDSGHPEIFALGVTKIETGHCRGRPHGKAISQDNAGMFRRIQHLEQHRLLAVVRASSVARSEEHTSELQSLMSSSYAVLCEKKKIH